MTSLVQIQDYMRKRLEADMKHRNVTVSGENLQDALRQASIELALPLKKIEYEVLDVGTKNLLGKNKTPYRVLAYSATPAVGATLPSIHSDVADIVAQDLSRDGMVYIRRDRKEIRMKITPPEKGGRRVTEIDVLNALARKNVVDADTAVLSKVVKKADSIFVKIANFDHDPVQDASMHLAIQDMDMSAVITITAPGSKGADPTADSLLGFLKAKGVTDGLLDDVLHKLADNPVYEKPILVAKGKQSDNGKDGTVRYEFQVNTDHIRLREMDGKIDYKDLGKINNVVEGQVLAKLVPPVTGVSGFTVTGKTLLAHSGKAVPLEIGDNVRLSEDGSSALATINGQVLLINGKIVVEPLFVVNNGVDLKTGNILFLGTVLVSGNVEDGFAVKASGNIEITGSVGKCDLDAEGDIIIRRGMNGRESGTITAGGNIYAKFIQNTKVVAGGMVIVSDGIINSTVASDQRILCRGKRASIVGGSLKAAEEINAKALGSAASVETHLEVGFDPKSKEKLDMLLKEEKVLKDRLVELNKDIVMLERTLKTQKKLPPDRMNRYKAFRQEREECKARLLDIVDEERDLNVYLSELKTSGKISASGIVFAGVKISIRDAYLEVKNEFKMVTFVNKNSLIKVKKYEEIDRDISMAQPFKR